MYNPTSIWKKFAGIVTWVFLFLLIPVSALGYVAEQTVPGNILYPLKRNIEKLVMTLESFDRSTLALYQVNLANKRFTEAETLLASNTPVRQLSNLPLEDMTTQIDSAKESINTISNPTEKKKTIETLLSNINSYQNRLEQIQTNYQSQNTTTFSQQQNSQTTGNTTVFKNNQPSQSDQQIATAIQQVQNTLQQDQVALQNADQNIANGGDGIIPTAIPTSPTPTLPSSQPTPSQTQNHQSVIVTPTPTVIINSCQTYCQSLQFAAGYCEQNANKCSKHNQTYESGGNQYCPASSQKACCCGASGNSNDSNNDNQANQKNQVNQGD